ncbi:hypothetical protein J1614_004180 [Plenodomus biglobosus]|nr:hypothetical protein J1614_004180 [Plenodomus biglobosus]
MTLNTTARSPASQERRSVNTSHDIVSRAHTNIDQNQTQPATLVSVPPTSRAAQSDLPIHLHRHERTCENQAPPVVFGMFCHAPSHSINSSISQK